MDIFADFAARVAAALKTLYPEASDDLIARAVVEPPRDAGHGDLSSNAAMIVAKPLGKNPREVAAALAEQFKADPDVETVLVNRFYLRGVEQIDKRTGVKAQRLPGQPLGGINWQDRS